MACGFYRYIYIEICFELEFMIFNFKMDQRITVQSLESVLHIVPISTTYYYSMPSYIWYYYTFISTGRYLAIINSSINFVIYCLVGTQFRSQLLNMLGKIWQEIIQICNYWLTEIKWTRCQQISKYTWYKTWRSINSWSKWPWWGSGQDETHYF